MEKEAKILIKAAAKASESSNQSGTALHLSQAAVNVTNAMMNLSALGLLKDKD